MKEYPKNSLFYWYPKIKDLEIPMPETIMLPFPSEDTIGALFFIDSDYREPRDDQLKKEYESLIVEACKKIGYPAFLRSDETSHKHGWKDTCYLTREEDIPRHLYELIEFTEMAGMMGGLSINGFVVREFMKLDTRFTAFHGRMPVAKEFRFFVKDGKLQCWHPYWFPACMVRPSIENWFDVLMDMEKLDELNLDMLTVWAELIGETVGGYWSIDFCKLKDESWAMTDMAQGEDSFHWSICKYAPENMKRYGDPYAMPEGWNATIYSDNLRNCALMNKEGICTHRKNLFESKCGLDDQTECVWYKKRTVEK